MNKTGSLVSCSRLVVIQLNISYQHISHSNFTCTSCPDHSKFASSDPVFTSMMSDVLVKMAHSPLW